MSTASIPVPSAPPRQTVADLLDALGASSSRVRISPPPGTATERDLLDHHRRENRLFELVDGTLVEKAMGYRASLLAGLILELLRVFNRSRNLGLVTGADGMVRLFPGLVRIPDVAFVSWDRIPGRCVPREPIPALVPELAVEVLSESNTPAEMDRKRRDYFKAGVKVVWEIDPDKRTAMVYTSPEQCSVLKEGDTMIGTDVLAGFAVSVGELFAELDLHGGVSE
jgi:Uma2 family endonuclease